MFTRLLARLLVASLALGGLYVAVHAQEAAPVLTELERTKLDLLQVRIAYARLLAEHDACKAENGTLFNTLGKLRADAASTELTADEAKLKADIERGHAGFTFDPRSGALTKKPPPAAPEKR